MKEKKDRDIPNTEEPLTGFQKFSHFFDKSRPLLDDLIARFIVYAIGAGIVLFFFALIKVIGWFK